MRRAVLYHTNLHFSISHIKTLTHTYYAPNWNNHNTLNKLHYSEMFLKFVIILPVSLTFVILSFLFYFFSLCLSLCLFRWWIIYVYLKICIHFQLIIFHSHNNNNNKRNVSRSCPFYSKLSTNPYVRLIIISKKISRYEKKKKNLRPHRKMCTEWNDKEKEKWKIKTNNNCDLNFSKTNK